VGTHLQQQQKGLRIKSVLENKLTLVLLQCTFISPQADMTFKKTRKKALKKRKYAVLTVYHRKNGVFTNF